MRNPTDLTEAIPELHLAAAHAEIKNLNRQLQDERTKRRRLEEKLQAGLTRSKLRTKRLLAVFDGFSEPLFLLGQDKTVQMLNKAAAGYCNIDFKDAIGKSCKELCCTDVKFCCECSFSKALEAGHQITRQRPGATGVNSRDLISVYPLQEKKHGMDGAILRIQDITEKEMIDEQLVLADRLASLSQLSSGIAHEIRNPLAGIMLFVDIMADPKRFQRSTQELEIINEIKISIQKISEIITRVPDFAKPISFEKNATDLNQTINKALRLWSLKSKEFNIEIDLDLQDQLPKILANSVELQQVFNNLILNSIEAMTTGGTLTITTRKDPSTFHPGRDVIFVRVADTGVGINPEHSDSIFNPFFSTKPGSAGLGQAISYQIVKRHGGVLSCSRYGAPGKGAVFTVELPILGEKRMLECC